MAQDCSAPAMKLPGKKARITVVMTPAGEALRNGEVGARQFCTCMDSAGPCEGMRASHSIRQHLRRQHDLHCSADGWQEGLHGC